MSRIDKFTSKASIYTKYRAGYPTKFLEYLEKKLGSSQKQQFKYMI